MLLDSVWMRIGLCAGLAGWLGTVCPNEVAAQSDPAGFDTVINAPPTIIGDNESIGSNTQLNVFEDEDVEFEVGSSFNVGSALGGSTNVELNIFSGAIDSAFSGASPNLRFTANSGSTTNVLGGMLGNSAQANSGSVVNISGGMVGYQFDANSGSVVNISGGAVGDIFDANSGSVVNVSGGAVGSGFDAFSGSEVNVSGGTFGRSFDAFLGSTVTFIGGEFLLNGEPPANPASVTLSGADVLTGTLEDGSVFVFSTPGGLDNLSGVTLQQGALPANNVLPIVIDNALEVPPLGLRAGQSLTLRGVELGRDFASVDATLVVEGGSIAVGTEVVNSKVTISDGEVASLIAFSGSEISLSRCDVGRLSLFESNAEISGGSLDVLGVSSGSVVDFTGGTLGEVTDSTFTGLGISNGGIFNVSGGSIDGDVGVFENGKFNLFVTEAFIDGARIVDLSPSESLTISQRGGEILSGLLADGSEFSFELVPFSRALGGDFFPPGSTVTVTLGTSVAGDFDMDGDVDADDIDFYAGSLASEATGDLAQLDLDGDGFVTIDDHDMHVATLVETENGQTGAIIGDMDLDGTVDVLTDAFILVAALGSSDGGYANGDLNADQVTDVLGDAFRLVTNLGRTNDSQ